MLARPLHRRALLGGTAILSFALWATGVALAVPGDLIEMEVLGVVPLDSETASILVLRQKGARTLLPIFIGRPEANEIDARLKHGTGLRGRGADLLRASIEALGGKVARVVIEGAGGKPFRGKVAVDQGRSHHDLEARPSDSVALALVSRAPIFATRHVMTESGLTEQELARKHGGGQRRVEDEPDDASAHVQSF